MDRMNSHAVVVPISCIAYENTFHTIVPYITISRHMADGDDHYAVGLMTWQQLVR